MSAYAQRVVDGEVLVGPHVRHACARHLRDLVEGPKRGLRWDLKAARHVLGFYRDVLCLNGGEFEGKPFVLLDWEEFVVGSLFGWKLRNGLRRFRMAYIESGKGSGKSPLVAGIGLYMVCADDEPRAEVYAAAYKKDQAKVLFRDAVAMVELSPALSERLSLAGKAEKTNIAHPASDSFFRPISTEERGRGQSGPRPHCALLDEIHEHATNAMVEFMRAGVKGRRQPLIVMITNSGVDRTSVCYDYHDYAAKVCAGQLEDDSFFGYVCALDEHDDPFKDPTCWLKANPSLGVTFPAKYLEDQVRQARGIPSKQNLVLRLNFCRWTQAQDGWIETELWTAVERELRLEPFIGRPCVLALDASWTTDLSSLAVLFPSDDGTLDAFVEFWKPKEGLTTAAERDRVPYDVWADQGHLHLCEGTVIRLPPIARRIAELNQRHPVTLLAYDAYRLKDLPDELADLGVQIPMIEHPQGFRRAGRLLDMAGTPVLDEDGKPKDNPLWMPNSVQEFENAIREQELRVAINPVLRWNIASVVVRPDPAGTDNRIFDKRRATGRIDGAVAMAMGVGAARSELSFVAGYVSDELVIL